MSRRSQILSPLAAPFLLGLLVFNVLALHSAHGSTLKKIDSFSSPPIRFANPIDTALIFDLPVTYNDSVKRWIHYFQHDGKKRFHLWLERSARYVPVIQGILKKNHMPSDLAYVAMIESGFSSRAISSAAAVGPWQFLRATGEQYGLRSNWWLDERRDFAKSTAAACRYLANLYPMFSSWYLAAAAYNMGENRLKRLIRKHGTNNYWRLSQKKDFATETKDYVPKLIAAILIAKAPGLYGFRELFPQNPLSYETIEAPGTTDLTALADHLGVTHQYMKDLNPELTQGFIPHFIPAHPIRIPQNAKAVTLTFLRKMSATR